jgi:methanogenesis imperfect marker protein 11
MLKLMEKRKELNQLIEDITHDKGFFDVQDLVEKTGLPRSTLQDWINRFVDEGCVEVLEERAGRRRAKYARRRSRTLPTSACKRIFTTADRDAVEIFHECRSEGCLSFCEYMYARGNPRVRKSGLILRQRVGIGTPDLCPDQKASLSLERVCVKDGVVYQHIRTFGGPAYSLTEMMEQADGVLDIKYSCKGNYTEGIIATEALTHLVIGVDDTDLEKEGATFALTLSLLDLLSSIEGVHRISHNVGFLYPGVPEKTAGNAMSYIELGVKPELVDSIVQAAIDYIRSQTRSEHTGMAVKKGLRRCPELVQFTRRARSGLVTVEEAVAAARKSGVRTYEVTGNRGIIGAVAALGMMDCPESTLMDVRRELVPLETPVS